MTAGAYSRLWPVLAALAALIGGSMAVEHLVAGGHVARVVRITATAGEAGDDDTDAEGGAGFAKTAPVDAGHAEARARARRGELAPALIEYRAALDRHPDAVALRAELGFWLLASGDAAGARAELERAAALDPRDPWVQLNLGIAWSRTGKLAEAERCYRAALALRAGFGAAELALGTVLRRQGKLAEAIAALTTAAASGGNSDRARALVALARAQLAAKHRPEAASAIERAIELAPADVDIRVAAGRAYLATGKQDDTQHAVELLTRAAELAPDVASVFSALGRAREKLGDRPGAEAAYTRAVRLDPEHRYARRRLLRLALERQDYPQARLAAEYLLATAPDEPEHHFLAGLVDARDDRPEPARAHYRDAIAKAKGAYPEAYFNLAIVEKNAGDLPAAIAAYRQAIALRPRYQQAWNNLGLALAASGDPAEAEAALAKALEIDEGYGAAWQSLGELRAAAGQLDQAVEAYAHAIKARPHDVDARLGLAAVQLRAGRGADAIATYRALVVVEPRAVTGWSELGRALAASGELAAARDAWAQALAIDPEHLPTLRQRAAATDGADAVAAWTEVLDRAADDAAARTALAAARLRTGDRVGCAHELEALPSTTVADPAVVRLRADCHP
ncbi:MAG: tetratricopeptide repeat protein [Myxococcales bacterium]|nr:tetratricopeptide repeat protein [Myxococcales bacterium]